MSYAAHRRDFSPYTAKLEAHGTNAPTKIGYWQRLKRALNSSEQSRADRQIARFIENRGGYLTDQIERELMRHMAASPHYWGMRL
jgi:hypothetical protein